MPFFAPASIAMLEIVERQASAANAGGKSAQPPEGTGVAARPDDKIPRNDEPLVGQKHVLDPHSSDFEVVHDPVFAGEFAHQLDLLGRPGYPVRREAVRAEGTSPPVS